MEVFSGKLYVRLYSCIWVYHGIRLWLVRSAMLHAETNAYLFGSALSFDFQSKIYFFLIHPIIAMAVLLSMAALLSKLTVRFERFRSTVCLLTTIYIYTFGASIISDLFMVFPCIEGTDDKIMIHDPGTSCYGYSSLIVLASMAICVYTAVAIYVLGFVFWSHKAVIQNPQNHDRIELEHTFKSFGFLFYGTHAQHFTHYC